VRFRGGQLINACVRAHSVRRPTAFASIAREKIPFSNSRLIVHSIAPWTRTNVLAIPDTLLASKRPATFTPRTTPAGFHAAQSPSLRAEIELAIVPDYTKFRAGLDTLP
jgi:hypothetical protein